MPDCKIGDRVRITRTWEGKVTAFGATGTIQLDNSRYILVAPSPGSATTVVEVLEPEYEVGAVYMDADGDVFMRRSSAREPWRDFDGDEWSESFPSHPLRKLVPEPGE